MIKKSDWIHEDIEELNKMDIAALESWLYGAKIITKINQRKIKQRAVINKENGISINVYGSKRKNTNESDE